MFAAAAHAEAPKICVSTWNLTNPYWVNVVNGAKERGAEVGAEIVVNDPSNDNSRQIASIENFVTLGCKAIIIAAIDPASTEQPLADARAAGVKIIAQSMETPVADVWASADEHDMGHTIGVEAGKWIAEKLDGKASVLVLNDDRQPQMIARKQGILDGIAEKAPDAKIVADQTAPDTATGMTVTESVLQANPGLNVVVANNDASALGALAAAESAGIDTTNMFIGGVDATPEAREKIDGKTAFRASVDNVPFDNGRQDVDFAMKLIAGEKIEYRQVIKVKAYSGK
ncbi:sugar ABC transporter substrate-binding protein [Ochrobactrum daejeonense]|nr:sugar ABC transporter substrate-binding protein [Brucella daejeonensis]